MTMRNTTQWKHMTHRDIFAAVEQMKTGLMDEEIVEIMSMGAGTRLGKWRKERVLPAIDESLAAHVDWEPLLTRTKAHFARLNAAEKAVVPLCRQVAGLALWNPDITDLHLEKLGLPPRTKAKNRPAPVMDKAPRYEVVLSRIRTVGIIYGDAESGTTRKPKGQHGAECCYLPSKHPLEDVSLEMLVQSKFSTRSSLLLEFSEQDRGSFVYLALRWENSRNVKGPFGQILCARVP